MAAAGTDARQRPKVVVARRIFQDFAQELHARFEVLDNQADEDWSREELLARLADAHGLLSDPGRQIDAPLLERCGQLCVVSNIAVGFNNIDLAACTRAGIAVTNTPDVLNDATADHAWALLMAAARGFAKVIGVEFSSELAAIARRNCLIAGFPKIEVITADACDLTPLAGNLVLYMYNPFELPVMRCVVANLLASRWREAEELYVIYLTPRCARLFDQEPRFQRIFRAPSLGVWSLRGDKRHANGRGHLQHLARGR